MYSRETVGKGAFINRMAAVKNYSTNTIIEKNKKGRRGARDQRYGIFSLTGEIARGFSRGLIKNNEQFSGREQEKIMCNFQGS